MQELSEKEAKEALDKLDQSTLHASVTIVSQVGFSHYNLSKDTRLTLEARKAHRFVAVNCEEISKKILRLTGLPDDAIEEALKVVAEKIVSFNKLMADKANNAAKQSKPAVEVLQ